uniref:DUF1768 domain-containing protein n=1 Tax=Strongyloides papillosus TaxID=174720 RepID=A0A0N5BJP5_STREA
MDNCETSYFSNFYHCPFVDDKTQITFNNVEQYFQYYKAALFKDEETQREILNADTPYEAKRLGGRVRNFQESLWNERRIAIMDDALSLKFSVPRMRIILKNFYEGTSRSSRKRTFIEISASRFWGCSPAIMNNTFNSNNFSCSNHYGSNMLGKSITRLAESLFN